MAFIVWSDGLSVGVEAIDRQHRELIGKINEIVDAMCEGEGLSGFCDTMRFLERYIVEHFAEEEKHMIEAGYEGYEAHKREHEKFLEQFGQHKAAYERDGQSARLEIQVQRWLYEWLKNHIRKTDKAFALHMRKVRWERGGDLS